MSDRTETVQRFLEASGWGSAARVELVADASVRSYTRLRRGDGQTAILMDGTQSPASEIRRFVSIGQHLLQHGFSAPEILNARTEAGLLLIEDFGDGVYARLVRDDSGKQERLYSAAVDMLGGLARIRPASGLPQFTAHAMSAMVEPLFDWYVEGCGEIVRPRERISIMAFIETALLLAPLTDGVMSLRDCHAENLMWLPEREGVARVGILDYQDAVLAHPAYDFISLVQDARRDLPDSLVEALKVRFVDATGQDRAAFEAACAVLGLQRNLRILGIFARLALQDGKTGYLAHMPRVWSHIDRNLNHPALAKFADRIRSVVPVPDETVLSRISAHAA